MLPSRWWWGYQWRSNKRNGSSGEIIVILIIEQVIAIRAYLDILSDGVNDINLGLWRWPGMFLEMGHKLLSFHGLCNGLHGINDGRGKIGPILIIASSDILPLACHAVIGQLDNRVVKLVKVGRKLPSKLGWKVDLSQFGDAALALVADLTLDARLVVALGVDDLLQQKGEVNGVEMRGLPFEQGGTVAHLVSHADGGENDAVVLVTDDAIASVVVDVEIMALGIAANLGKQLAQVALLVVVLDTQAKQAGAKRGPETRTGDEDLCGLHALSETALGDGEVAVDSDGVIDEIVPLLGHDVKSELAVETCVILGVLEALGHDGGVGVYDVEAHLAVD